MAKGFASTTDLGREEDHVLRDRHRSLCLHRRRRSEHRRDRRRGRLPRVRRAGDARDGEQGDRARAHRHRQADQICRAVALSRRARARRVGLQGARRSSPRRKPTAGRRARPAGLGFRIWPVPAPVPGCPEHSRPDLADADLRRRDVDLSRKTRGALDAARRRTYLRRYRRLGAGCRGDVFRRPHRISLGLLLRRRAFAGMADDAERNPQLQSEGDRARPRRRAEGPCRPRATRSR